MGTAEGIRRIIGPATAATVLSIEVLISLADVRRTVFILVTVVAATLTIGLAAWYVSVHDHVRAAAAGGGCMLVLVLAWVGAPSEVEPAATSTTPEPRTSGVSPRYDSTADDIVVEQPSESEVLFRPLSTPWYNDIEGLFSSATVEDAEGEAAVMGAWWAAADWCARKGHGSRGRCYDLAALSLAQTFDRDPRTMNGDNWWGAGAIGSVVTSSYETTSGYLRFKPRSRAIPVLFRNRPGLDWYCEPSCTAGIEKRS